MIAKSHPKTSRTGFSDSFPYSTRFSGGRYPLAYFDIGSGPAVVMVHGLACNFTHWEHVVPALARSHRVIGIDLLGYGDSAKPPIDYTLDLLVDTLLGVCDELAVHDAAFVGHSLGGMVAMRTALRFPERVRRLALLSAAGFQAFPRWLQLGTRALYAPAVAKLMEYLSIPLLNQRVFAERNFYTRKFMEQVEGRDPHPTVDEFARVTCSLARDLVKHRIVDDLERIVQPTLVLWGDKDRLLPMAPVAAQLKRMPSARMVVLPGVGHMPMIERPSAVVSELLPFLGESWRWSFSGATESQRVSAG